MSKSKGQLQVDFLKSVIAAGGKIVKASFAVEHALGPKNPTYLLTLDQHGTLTLQDLPWTQELEEYLLHERPTAMATHEEERARFANILGNNLKTLESQFGRDYAQAVFVEILKEHPEYDLARLLAKAPTYPPSRGSAGYQNCRQFLEHAISGLQNTAVLTLGHPNGPETVRLIGEALAIVLDDRFHISLRAQLFPD
jgi:hypothetical protein